MDDVSLYCVMCYLCNCRFVLCLIVYDVIISSHSKCSIRYQSLSLTVPREHHN